jgi:hypothetical protein
MKDEILEILNQNKSYAAYSSRIKEKFPSLHKEFLEKDCSYAAAVYMFVNDITETPICPVCSSPTKYVDRSEGFRTFCSNRCKGKSKDVVNKRRKTNLRRYGHINAACNNTVKEKKKQTMLKRYGVEHILQHEEFSRIVKDKNRLKNKEEIVAKRNETNLNRYGTENLWELEWFREKIDIANQKKYGCHPLSRSTPKDSLEKLNDKQWIIDNSFRSLKDLANELDITYQGVAYYFSKHGVERDKTRSYFEKDVENFLNMHNIKFLANDRSLISPLEIDFYIPEQKLAIECNGAYWHSELNGKDKNYHLHKKKGCYEKGVELIHIWDFDWYNKSEIIKQRLLNKLHRSEKIYARNTVVDEINKNLAQEFCNKNHIQGYVQSCVRLSLVHKDQIVAVMTFGKSRFTKRAEWELLRYCSSGTIVGGPSKLFSYFLKNFSPKSVISYADNNWSTGNLYSVLGFSFSHNSLPSYRYTKDYAKLENRLAYQKHKLADILDLFDPDLTEWENMQINGYDRIWDCGNSVWIYES